MDQAPKPSGSTLGVAYWNGQGVSCTLPDIRPATYAGNTGPVTITGPGNM